MPFIKPQCIDRIFEADVLHEVIGQYVDLKKSGSSYKGLSPFTDENTPSFMISPAKGIWKDYSSGKGGNSSVKFIMELKGATYQEALKVVADKYGIPIEYEDSEKAQEYQRKQEKIEGLLPLMEAVVRKMEEQLQRLPEDHAAMIELKKRGYSKQIIEDYRIGYAPGKQFLYKLCKEVGLVDQAKELGLINDKNQDKWTNRLIYPLIQNRSGRSQVIGLSGRRLDDNKKFAKWLNSKESDLFQKRSFWYGLDKARAKAAEQDAIWIVEGYNDVIAWQTNGFLNTVAPCGTGIHETQRRALKKVCDEVILCFDSDKAGRGAYLSQIPEFLASGFKVRIFELFPGQDPDDFIREFKPYFQNEGLEAHLKSYDFMDGFKYLVDKRLPKEPEEQSEDDNILVTKIIATKSLCEVIASIPSESLRSAYMDILKRDSGQSITAIRKWVKEYQQEDLPELTPEMDAYYELPHVVNTPLAELRKTIDRYQMFMDQNQIWVQSGFGPPFKFQSVSNFSIEIIQHMQDDKWPSKLIRVRNIYGLQRVFDVPSESMNTPMAFENAVTAHGNFRWKGGRKEHELLKTFLFDRMGNGRRVEVLGWQPEGFWVWNNKVTVPGAADIEIDENGVFVFENTSYYVPSANKVYRMDPTRYEEQKKFVCIQPECTFENYAAQVIKVHREHGIMGLLHAVASPFQDIVTGPYNFFPMMFLFGPASSGKDQLADVCQSFFGKPQTAINLEGGVSTMKANVRELSKFFNGLTHLSEYRSDQNLDGLLKGYWDRRGYKRATIESRISSESLPVLSSVIITGNFPPEQEALITRLVWNFMDKSIWSNEEGQEYEKLNDMTKKGISGFTDTLLHHREHVKEHFKAKYREFKETITDRHPEANGRMITNLSVYGAFYHLLKDVLAFPFSHKQMLDHFDYIIRRQMTKLSSASKINRWWDCFVASMRGSIVDRINYGVDFKLDGNRLYFNFTHCYNRVSRQWFSQYRDSAPGKGVMRDALEKDISWIEKRDSIRMGKGRECPRTSAFVVDLNKLPISDVIKASILTQTSENGLFPSPATPNDQSTDKDDEKTDEIPF